MEISAKEHTNHEEDVAGKPNGLLMHEQVQLSEDEMRAERRLVWKADLLILPLLSLMYFLASMVSISLHSISSLLKRQLLIQHEE
jgi:hypothetical protein